MSIIFGNYSASGIYHKETEKNLSADYTDYADYADVLIKERQQTKKS
ncbi:MAG: hypothetical protein V1749_09745 [Candidatus Desantisbacteria bacterium]